MGPKADAKRRHPRVRDIDVYRVIGHATLTPHAVTKLLGEDYEYGAVCAKLASMARLHRLEREGNQDSPRPRIRYRLTPAGMIHFKDLRESDIEDSQQMVAFVEGPEFLDTDLLALARDRDLVKAREATNEHDRLQWLRQAITRQHELARREQAAVFEAQNNVFTKS